MVKTTTTSGKYPKVIEVLEEKDYTLTPELNQARIDMEKAVEKLIQAKQKEIDSKMPDAYFDADVYGNAYNRILETFITKLQWSLYHFKSKISQNEIDMVNYNNEWKNVDESTKPKQTRQTSHQYMPRLPDFSFPA